MVEARDDGLAQAVHGECYALESIGGDLAQDGFEFGKELFDGVEVWTIGWNVEQRCAARFDRLFDSRYRPYRRTPDCIAGLAPKDFEISTSLRSGMRCPQRFGKISRAVASLAG